MIDTDEITVTQQRRAAVVRACDAGFTVYDGTRGNASYPASGPAVDGLIAQLESVRQHGSAIAYGQSSLGELHLLGMAKEALEKQYPHTNIRTERIAFFPGAQFGLIAAMNALLRKGKKQLHDGAHNGVILAQWPGYPNYQKLFTEAKKLAATPDASFGHIDVGQEGYATAAAIEASIEAARQDGKPVDAIILTIPSNPQGRIPPRQEQEAIIGLLQKFPDIPVIIDESFIEIDFRKHDQDRFKSITHIAQQKNAQALLDRAFIVRSGTKAASLAGFRPNLILMPQDENIIASMKATAATFLGNTGLAEQILMAQWLHSLSDSKQADISDHYADNLFLLTKPLDALGVPYTAPDGGFFLMFDASELMKGTLPPDMARTLGKDKLENDNDLFRLFLEVGHQNGREKLGVMPGSDFGYAPEKGMMRICFGPGKNEIAGACNVITNICNRIREHNHAASAGRFTPVAEQPANTRRSSWASMPMRTAAALALATGLAIGTVSRQEHESRARTPAHWSPDSNVNDFAGIDLQNEAHMRRTFGDKVTVSGVDVDMGVFVSTIAPLLKHIPADHLYVTGENPANNQTYIFVGDETAPTNVDPNTSLGTYAELVRNGNATEREKGK